MSLLYWNPQWLHFGSSTHLQNFLSGQEVFLCGTGPSLKETNTKDLEESGKLICSLNNAVKYVSSHIWCGVDSPDSFVSSFWNTPALKLYNYSYSDKEVEGRKIYEYPNTYFFQPASGEEAPFGSFNYEGNTFSVALHLLRWMGVNKIYLVGCDFGGSNELSKIGPKYKSQKYDSKGQAHALNSALDLIKFISEKKFMNIISCTPESRANKVVPYTPLKECLKL